MEIPIVSEVATISAAENDNEKPVPKKQVWIVLVAIKGTSVQPHYNRK